MTLLLVSVAGMALFLYPLTGRQSPATSSALGLAVGVVVLLAAVESGLRRLDARAIALLATLAALDSALRMALVTGLAGFSPVFFLLLCAGWVFGPSYGFLAGALTLLVSALVTGGAGPWLPFQMFAAGWVGAGAGLLGAGLRNHSHAILWLALAGGVLGFAYGATMDLWDWTYFRAGTDFGFAPGLSLAELATRFGRYYLATSAFYDSFRAAGNVILVVAMGPPVLAMMARFRQRLTFTRLEA
ncbi:MAG: ECF transporter S component [Candidatus Dormibacteria bacterium]